MMAPNHTLSGVALWTGGCATASLLGHRPSAVLVWAGAVVFAAGALAPDIDHPDSTMARSVGWVSRVFSRVVSYLADLVRDLTCRHCRTPGANGHRTLTHTLVFAVAAGFGVRWAGQQGPTVVAWIVGVSSGVVVLGLFGVRGRWFTAVLVGAAVGIAVWRFGGDVDWSWLGLAAGGGTLTHSLGDALTERGAPIWWPLKIDGCRWYDWGLPQPLRFRTDGAVEWWLFGLFVIATVVAGWLLYGSQVQAAWAAAGGG